MQQSSQAAAQARQSSAHCLQRDISCSEQICAHFLHASAHMRHKSLAHPPPITQTFAQALQISAHCKHNFKHSTKFSLPAQQLTAQFKHDRIHFKHASIQSSILITP